MKTTWYAVILGLAALVSWSLWRAPVSSTKSVAPEPARETASLAQPIQRPLVTRSKPIEVATTDGFVERLQAELTFLGAESDPLRRDEKLQVLIDSLSFREIPATL